jgi:hypothetical protein
MYAIISSFNILPSFPVAFTNFKFISFSLAIFLTVGVVKILSLFIGVSSNGFVVSVSIFFSVFV